MRAFVSRTLATALIGAPIAAQNQAEAEQQSIESSFARATLVVRDADVSLSLYRDALGLGVVGDRPVSTEAISAPSTGEPGAKARLIMLRGAEPTVGWIGLIQWTEPAMPEPGSYPARLQPGSTVLVFRVPDAEAACARAAEVPGVTVTAPMNERTFMGSSPDNPVRVRTCTFFDPDGHLLEVSQRIAD